MVTTDSTAPVPYGLSGKSGHGWLLFPIGIVSGFVGAFVYAWINVYSPIAGYISLLFTALLAGLAIVPVAIAAKKLRVRNAATAHIAGAATGLATLYFAWACFIWVFLIRYSNGDTPGLFDIVGTPGAVWGFAKEIAENGWYTISGATPSGIVLWILWALEAAIVIGGCTLFATLKIQGRAFCEDCNTWMTDEAALALPADEGTPGQKLKKGGLAALQEIASQQAGSRWLVLQRQRCAQCKAAAVWRADDVKRVQSGKEVKNVSTPVVPLSWQTEADAAEFARIAQALEQTTAAKPA